MTDIEEIFNDGFFLNNKGRRLKSLAALSLKIALKSYFSTYQSMKYFLHTFEGETEVEEVISNSEEYCEQCSEAIIHFHHFFELVCKEILTSENPLLAVDVLNKHTLYDKLLRGETITEEEKEKLKSIEFGVTIERLCELMKERNLGEGTLDFIADSKKIFQKLNLLRNRLLHRGIFILNYPSFDKLVGKFLLPLVIQILNIPYCKDLTTELWKYNELSCGIDPIDEIINEFNENRYDITKIAFLKELGRSSYNNQIKQKDTSFSRIFYNEKIKRFEKMANSQIGESNICNISKCPVCGLHTLAVYDDIEIEDYDIYTNSFSKGWRYTWQVECINCNFEINHHLKNPSEYGFNIPDYWEGEALH